MLVNGIWHHLCAIVSQRFVNELSDLSDLLLCENYMSTISRPPVNELVSFYNDTRSWAKKVLVDGAGHSPHFSLRTFVVHWYHSVFQLSGYSLERSLYEGLCMSFVTQLENVSMKKFQRLLKSDLSKFEIKDFSHAPRTPRKSQSQYIPIFGLIEQGRERLMIGLSSEWCIQICNNRHCKV